MSTSKKKKHGSNSSLPVQSARPSLMDQVEEHEHKLDDEPKVSFTLEFYAVDEKSTSFIGRLKKMGSDEQVSLIENLDVEKIVEFIERNLPKAWQEKIKMAPQAEIQLLKNSEEPVAEQVKPIKPLPPAELLPSIQLGGIQTATRNAIEVWQNGQFLKTIRSELPATVFFEVGEQRLWQSVDAHFKSLEQHIPDLSFSKCNVFAEKISLELSAGQLNPGIYSLSVRAGSEQDSEQNPPSQVSDNQIIQVI